MNKYYTIKITGGTSQGPYTIYNCGFQPSNISSIYSTLLPASNLTRNMLMVGVTINVPNECNTVHLYNTYCSTYQSFNVTSPSVFENLYLDIPIKKSQNPQSMLGVSINQPSCLCDGSIIFNSDLDNPPFTYSIDNGITFSNLPIFTNLCSGIYSLVMIDSLSNEYYKTVEIFSPAQSITYSISLITTNTTTINTTTALSKSYQTNVVVSPPLPDGTTITFDILHNNSFYSSPLSGTSILTTGTVLSKDGVTLPISTTTTGSSQSINTTPGCQTSSIYQTDLTEGWNSVSITNVNSVVINTTTRVDRTTTGSCVVGYSNDSYSIGNAKITGCDCCTLIINT